MQIQTRFRGPRPDEGSGAAPSARPPGLAERLAALRASQAALSAETRLRRLLLALVVPEIVLALVLLLAGSYVGVIVAVLAAVVQVGAALLLVPGDVTAATAVGPRPPAPPTVDPAVLAGQGEEIAALRGRLESAETGLALQNELARRHRELLLRQLARIDALEADEADPTALGELFALDHLATRMRRYSEGALLVAGSPAAGASDAAPVLASEVLRGAVAEIEDFNRVDVSVDGDVPLAGAAVVDLVHLLAELIENATVFSSPTTRVTVHGTAGEAGYVVTITDAGVGIAPERAEALRALLAADSPGATPGHLGFQLVARLARRQGVVLDVTAGTGPGATVRVALPPSLVVGEAAARPSAIVPPPPDAQPVAWTAAAAGAVPALTIPEVGAGAPVPPPVPAVAPEPVPEPAPEPVAYVEVEVEVEAATPEAAAAADTAQAASAVEAGFTGVTHAPEADWAGLPLPIEHLDEPSVLPYDLGDAIGVDDPADTAVLSVVDPAAYDEPPFVPDPSYDEPPFVPEPSYDEVAPYSEPAYDPEPALAWQAPLPAEVPLPAEPERLEPAPFVPPAVLVPAHAPQDDAPGVTDAGLARRTPQAHMAPQMAGDAYEPLAEDGAAVPAPDRSRSLLSAYRDGLVLGRGGLTPDDVRHHIDDREPFDAPFDETGESR